jgi:geranylgeranyl diphosphate synthase type II
MNNNWNLKEYIVRKQDKINQTLKNLLPLEDNDVLSKAINYSIFPEGKRFRPILCIATYETSLPEDENILNIASSLELFHTFTLIHDDLPCMDNDDYRRGKPSSHKVFGEAVALLAGDALFNLGYEVIINSKIPEGTKINLIKEISSSLGIKGVVGGQAKDITKKKNMDILQLKEIYLKKTASLIEASVKMGGIVALLDQEKLRALSCYGRNLGLAFQIMDDVIEAKEKQSNEENYVTLVGIENAKNETAKAIDKAKGCLSILGEHAKILNSIADWCIERKN